MQKGEDAARGERRRAGGVDVERTGGVRAEEAVSGPEEGGDSPLPGSEESTIPDTRKVEVSCGCRTAPEAEAWEHEVGNVCTRSVDEYDVCERGMQN